MRWQMMIVAGCGLWWAGTAGFGQAVRARPYSAPLTPDPAVGTIQGIQRYGRPRQTDPQQGDT